MTRHDSVTPRSRASVPLRSRGGDSPPPPLSGRGVVAGAPLGAAGERGAARGMRQAPPAGCGPR